MTVSTAGGDARDTVWRVTVAGRILAVAGVVTRLALAVGVTVGGTPGIVAAELWAALTGVVVVAWRWYFALFIALTDTGVLVQNPVVRTTVAYTDIAAVQGGYYGLTITRHSGGSVAAWAVQKSNLRRWQRRQDTRADEVAEAIRTRAGHGG